MSDSRSTWLSHPGICFGVLLFSLVDFKLMVCRFLRSRLGATFPVGVVFLVFGVGCLDNGKQLSVLRLLVAGQLPLVRLVGSLVRR